MKFEIKIQDIVSESYCYEHIRSLRWSEGVRCTSCDSTDVIKNGGEPQQRYQCKSCNTNFDDLTDTIFSGSKLPLKSWVLCLYFMGLNLSNNQIAQELELSTTTIHNMTSKLREGISKKKLVHHLAEQLNSMKFTS